MREFLYHCARGKMLVALAALAALAVPSLHGIASGQTAGQAESPFVLIIQMDRSTFAEDEPVVFNMIIKNTSDKKEFFVSYDTSYTTYQPVVYDAQGREAAITVPYRLMNRRVEEVVRDMYPRAVELLPNETLTHTVNLKNLYDLRTGAEYRVRGFFLPDMRNPSALPSSNILSFKIVRAPGLVKKSGVVRQERGVSPSEVVLLALTAEKNGTWDRLYKYIKADTFINAFPDYVRLYNTADEIEKLRILEEFARFLARRRDDYIKDFSITDEIFLPGKNIAYVDVVVNRYGPRLPFRFKYRYTLEKTRDHWLIIDLEATVLKGER
ncbi:MAG: hypothetical protein EHM32_08860 [Spirochaetales bacterium]|nr:MAG: hypothetical protein EHM32_08860 [Spirochaetales bacterium]